VLYKGVGMSRYTLQSSVPQRTANEQASYIATLTLYHIKPYQKHHRFHPVKIRTLKTHVNNLYTTTHSQIHSIAKQAFTAV
jgi:hypothetical protein